MRCADCPDLGETGTRKRAICCLVDGKLRRASDQVGAKLGVDPDPLYAQLSAMAGVSNPFTAEELTPYRADDSNAAMATAALRAVVPPGTPLNNRADRRRAAARYGRKPKA